MIFPLEKNLNVCSFFYDFITRGVYGQRIETFQYNHVTNYAIREIEPDTERPSRAGVALEPETAGLVSELQGKSLKALTIAAASGSQFRCVLFDEDVAKTLNTYLKNEEKYRQIEASQVSDEELQQRFQGDLEQIQVWKEAESRAVSVELDRVLQNKQQILWNPARTAKTTLNHVRNCIEHYVEQVQQPG